MSRTEGQSTAAGGRRTDARRNRERILLAARDLFAEHGLKVPFDTVAQRAGVGNATLYRHFPSREHLARAVALEVQAQTAAAADQALREEPDGFAALARYMHQAIDLRIAAVMPIVVDELPGDVEILRAAQVGAEAVERLFEAALTNGHLRPDIGVADIGLLLVRLSRPIMQIAQATNDALAHRHLDLLLDGMRVGPVSANDRLPGPALDFDHLRKLATTDQDASSMTGDTDGRSHDRHKEQ